MTRKLELKLVFVDGDGWAMLHGDAMKGAIKSAGTREEEKKKEDRGE
jgi:hypothetical protein